MSSCVRWMMLGFCLPCCALGWITRQPSCSWHLHRDPVVASKTEAQSQSCRTHQEITCMHTYFA
ncbi:hypothetical protein BC831DRAFT_453835 [Entophlyctis helioformis]|nr:hypothetical protein BC831DRAFT_453835 [Entophlyctis helioformis]